jgi:hypothetical protein
VADTNNTAELTRTAANESENIKAESEDKASVFAGFQAVLSDILQDITRLEVNTIIVSNISTDSFDARNFYEDLMYLTPDGLGVVRKSLDGWRKYIEDHKSRKDLSWYEDEVEQYKRSAIRYERSKQELEGLENFSSQRQERQQCYQELTDQVLKLRFPKDYRGRIKPDASSIRFLRQLWENEQTLLHGDRIYAQTRLELDGDLTNRFVEDLLLPSHKKLDASTAKIILDIHFNALKNAESQWSTLIANCVGLVEKLAPKRK